jgi:hypothetical protein
MRYSVSMAKAKHVLYSGDKWVVKTQGRAVSQSTGSYRTQREAVVAARALAKKAGGDLVIHGRDGRIRDVDSYRTDASADKLIPSG